MIAGPARGARRGRVSPPRAGHLARHTPGIIPGRARRVTTPARAAGIRHRCRTAGPAVPSLTCLDGDADESKLFFRSLIRPGPERARPLLHVESARSLGPRSYRNNGGVSANQARDRSGYDGAQG